MKNLGKVFLTFILLTGLSVFVKAQPASPTNLTATQSKWDEYMSVKLNWQPNIYRDMDYYFNVYRKTGGISDTGTFVKMYTHIHMNFWFDKYVQ